MPLTDVRINRVVTGVAVPVFTLLAEDVVAGDVLGYSDGWKRADASTPIMPLFVAGEEGHAGQTITAYGMARVGGHSGGTPGAVVYLSNTPGAVSETPGSHVCAIGRVMSTSGVFLFPGVQLQKEITTPVSLDLSGEAVDLSVWAAMRPCRLAGVKLVYTEASNANDGVEIRVGKYADGVDFDDDFFLSTDSEVSKPLGYIKSFAIGDLSETVINIGDVVTVGTAGGKTGTGEVRVVLIIV